MALNIEMQGLPVLVVGGGQVACRKVKRLLTAGARVRLVAPRVLPELATLATEGQIALRSGAYRSDDLAGVFLAIAATDNAQVNAQVAADAGLQGILVTVCDAPGLGTCTFPAVMQRGGLEIAVSTSGRCPAFAVHVRDTIASLIGDEYAEALERLAAEREKLLTDGKASPYNSAFLRSRVRELIAEITEHKERVP